MKSYIKIGERQIFKDLFVSRKKFGHKNWAISLIENKW